MKKIQHIKIIVQEDTDLVCLAICEVEKVGYTNSILLNSDIHVNGIFVFNGDWEKTRTKQGDTVEIFPNVYATLAGIGVYLLQAAISTALAWGVTWLVNKLFPPDKPKTSNAETKSSYQVQGANNTYRPFEPLPCVIGTYRTAPDFAVPYYSVVENNNIGIRHLFVVSVGDVDVWDIRKGSTPITSLYGLEYHIYKGWRGEPLKWFNTRIQASQENFLLADNAIFKTQSAVNVNGVGFIINFPQGLYSYEQSSGDKSALGITLTITLYNLDTEESIVKTESIYNSDPTLSTVRRYISYDFPEGKWQISIKSSAGGKLVPDTHITNSYIIEVQWHFDEPTLLYTGQAMTLIELKATASDKLTGGLDTINCMARLQGKNANGRLVKSSNIALLARRLLTDSDLVMNTEFVQIDEDSFDRFETHCAKYDFTANTVETSGRSLGEVLSEMLDIGQGYITGASGKYEIFYDDPEQAIVDVINSRNSWGMNITTSRPIKEVDGIRMTFNNKDKDYQTEERLVAQNGVNPQNAELMQVSMIDNAGLAYKYAMLTLASSKLRNSIIKFSTDWRSIDYKLGQKLLINHQAFFYGIGTAGKVVALIKDTNGFYTALVLDQYYSTDFGKQYALHNSSKYSLKYWDIKAVQDEETNTLFFTVPIMQEKDVPQLGDMLIFGESEKVGLEVLIRNITRNADYSAEIECIPSAKGYYSAIEGNIPDFESSLTFPNAYDKNKPSVPVILSIQADDLTAVKNSKGEIVINAHASMLYRDKDNVAFSHYKVSYKKLEQETYTEITGNNKELILIPNVKEASIYNFEVASVSKEGLESEYVTTQFKVLGLKRVPNPPDNIFLNKNILEISLEKMPIDFAGYEIFVASNINDDVMVANKITNPLNLDSLFDMTNYLGFAKKVFVRTVDLLGNKSEYISILINLGDKIEYNLLEHNSELASNWQGDIEGGYLTENKLIPNLQEEIFCNGIDEITFNTTQTIQMVKAFLNATKNSTVQYTYEVFIKNLFQNVRLDVKPILESGEVENIEFAVANLKEKMFYNSADEIIINETIFYDAVNEIGFLETELSKYRPLAAGYFIEKDISFIKIRVTFSNKSPLICTDILTIFDIPDAPNLIMENVLINNEPTLIQIPNNRFRKIKNVNINMRLDENYPEHNAFLAKTLHKGFMEDGYIVDGVILSAYDINGNQTKGLCDLTIQGY